MRRAAEGMRRRQPNGDTPWAAGECPNADDRNRIGDCPATFEWPPSEDVFSSQVVKFPLDPVEDATKTTEVVAAGKSVAGTEESERTASTCETAVKVDAREMLNPQHASARPPQDAPKVAPERNTQDRHATIPSKSWNEVWAAAVRSRAVIGAVVLMILTVLAGVAVTRRPSRPVQSVMNRLAVILPAVSGTDAPVPQRQAPVVRSEPRIVQTPLVAHRPDIKTSDAKAAQVLPAGGRLVIDSSPAGAEILINGRHYGVTPKTLRDVAPGQYRLVLRRDGTEVRQTINMARGATVSVVAPLQPASTRAGWISIASPIQTDVFEDGVLLGTSRSPRLMLEAGSHTLDLVNEPAGFRMARQVHVRPGSVEQIGVELPLGTIHLNAVPWAEVWIDGTSVGQTPIGNHAIAIGPHQIVFRHPVLGEKTMVATVRVDVPTRLTAKLAEAAP